MADKPQVKSAEAWECPGHCCVWVCLLTSDGAASVVSWYPGEGDGGGGGGGDGQTWLIWRD